jgi:hypothetical protein
MGIQVRTRTRPRCLVPAVTVSFLVACGDAAPGSDSQTGLPDADDAPALELVETVRIEGEDRIGIERLVRY